MKNYLFVFFILVFFSACSQKSFIKKTVEKDDFKAFKAYVDKAKQDQKDQMISDCNLFDKEGMWGREAVDLKYLKYLLDKGANPNILSLKTQQRAGICAANYLFKNKEAMKLLLDYEMNPFLPAHSGVRSLFQHLDNQLNSMPNMRKLVYSYKEDFLEYKACKDLDKLFCFKRVLLINPNSKYKIKFKIKSKKKS